MYWLGRSNRRPQVPQWSRPGAEFGQRRPFDFPLQALTRGQASNIVKPLQEEKDAIPYSFFQKTLPRPALVSRPAQRLYQTVSPFTELGREGEKGDNDERESREREELIPRRGESRNAFLYLLGSTIPSVEEGMRLREEERRGNDLIRQLRFRDYMNRLPLFLGGRFF